MDIHCDCICNHDRETLFNNRNRDIIPKHEMEPEKGRGNMYSYHTRISYSESDEELKLTIPAMLNFFQDAAIFEAEDGSITMNYLKEKHLAWLLGSWQIVIERRPRLGEAVTVTTNPYEFKGFIGYRNFTLTTEKNEVLVKAASIWTLVDIQAMKPARTTPELLAGYDLSDKLDMEYAPRRIDVQGEGCEKEPFYIRRNQIDSNHHVNNAEYVNMAMEYLGDGKQVKQVRVEYKKPAYLHETVTPVVYEQEHKLQVKLNDRQQQTYAVVEFCYE